MATEKAAKVSFIVWSQALLKAKNMRQGKELRSSLHSDSLGFLVKAPIPTTDFKGGTLLHTQVSLHPCFLWSTLNTPWRVLGGNSKNTKVNLFYSIFLLHSCTMLPDFFGILSSLVVIAAASFHGLRCRVVATGFWCRFRLHLIILGIHRWCGWYVDSRITWTTLFSYTESHNNGIDIVIRVDTSFGFNERVQGHVILQQFGNHNLYRLLISGHLPPGEENSGQFYGKPLVGAVYLPDGLVWTLEHKKVKSSNTPSVRGHSSRILFGHNITGTTSIQITFIYNSGNDLAKDISTSFQGVLNGVEENVDKTLPVLLSVTDSFNEIDLHLSQLYYFTI